MYIKIEPCFTWNSPMENNVHDFIIKLSTKFNNIYIERGTLISATKKIGENALDCNSRCVITIDCHA